MCGDCDRFHPPSSNQLPKLDMLDWRNLGGGLTSHPGLTFYVGLKNFWKTAELIDHCYVRSKSAHFSFWSDPYMFYFYFANKKSCFFGGFIHKRGSQVAELAKNGQKCAKIGDFGNFSKNRPTCANKSSKIVSRVLFWYPGICATQIHLRSSISGSNSDLVSFLKPKIVIFRVFWDKF